MLGFMQILYLDRRSLPSHYPLLCNVPARHQRHVAVRPPFPQGNAVRLLYGPRLNYFRLHCPSNPRVWSSIIFFALEIVDLFLLAKLQADGE